ncbi:MAG: hypothetical protein AAGJ39_04060, partial [Pseudomonadota bacterium]
RIRVSPRRGVSDPAATTRMHRLLCKGRLICAGGDLANIAKGCSATRPAKRAAIETNATDAEAA